jgi:CheY-like chemotaxis protein
MARKILWFENEVRRHEVFADHLRRNGHEVRLTGRVSEAESLLLSGAYDLLILDVMIPTWSEAEEQDYPPDQTGQGRLTGLAFFRRMKHYLERQNIPVLVYTINRDTQVFEAFKAEGLPEGRFATKIECRDPDELLSKIQEILEAA